MDTRTLFKNLRAMRVYSHRVTSGLGDALMLKIPEGASNNILWNHGHVITDEVNMLYTTSGLDSPLPASYFKWFDPGTSPADWADPPDPHEVLDQSKKLTDTLIADYEAGKFADFKPYNLAETYSLDSIEEAIAYHTIHEATHIGVNLTLRKLVS